MRYISRWAVFSLTCLPVAGLAYVLGRLEGDRMVAADQGWEMVFYWSPLVFGVIDDVVIIGVIMGLAGLALESGMLRRMQATLAGLICLVSFLGLPWR